LILLASSNASCFAAIHEQTLRDQPEYSNSTYAQIGKPLEKPVPLLASSVSKRLRPSVGRANAALRARFASISFCASSQASSRSIGLSIVPPETKLEDMVVYVVLGLI